MGIWADASEDHERDKVASSTSFIVQIEVSQANKNAGIGWSAALLCYRDTRAS